MYMGGRRISGVRRTRYSHTEHRERWDKVGRFIMQSLKLLVLLILLLVVRSFELEHRVDIKRQRWTCDVLLFYFLILHFTSLSTRRVFVGAVIYKKRCQYL